MRHSALTIESRAGWSKDLDIRSADRFNKAETMAIYNLPSVTGVLAPSPCHLKVGVASEYELEQVKGDVMRILQRSEQ